MTNSQVRIRKAVYLHEVSGYINDNFLSTDTSTDLIFAASITSYRTACFTRKNLWEITDTGGQPQLLNYRTGYLTTPTGQVQYDDIISFCMAS